ncbi:hypothetical protein DD237_007796 [Peronospora effusa]|uniref:Uncharacterized protein n=1 Tax=Peronospora effusa TaxID=542832 RepID=A0A3R8CR56_9STRA|nr:hypothetical protein DD237_007796 [Peronospora effusa]
MDQEKRMRDAAKSVKFSSMFDADFVGKLHRDALGWSDLRGHQVPLPGMDHIMAPRPRQQQLAPQRAQPPSSPSGYGSYHGSQAKATAACAAARTATFTDASSIATVPADATASSAAS